MGNTVGGSAINLGRTGPVIDYTSADYESLKQDLTAFAQQNYSDRWTDFNPDQFAVVFLDLISYVGDMLFYYQNAALRELTTPTVQRRQHMVELAKSFGYVLRSAAAAGGTLNVITVTADLPVTVLSTKQFSSGSVIFQPDQDYTLTTGNGTNNGDGTYTHQITVVEGQLYSDVSQGTSDGSREQAFQIAQTPIIDGTLTVKVNGVAWTKVRSFTEAEPGDELYRIETDDDDKTTIFFGDGVNGKIPPIGQSITATFKIGGGRRGNVGADTVTTIVTAITGVQSVTNPSAMSGGSDKETVSTARNAIPGTLAAGDRAVTVADFATIAAAASTGVAKSMARRASSGTVEIAIAPVGGGLPSTLLKNTVAAYVNARRVVGSEIVVIDPTYVEGVVAIDLYVDPSANRALILQVISELFRTGSSTEVQDALFDFDNVGFAARDDAGEPQLTIQRVYDLITSFRPLGVQNAILTRFDTIPLLRQAPSNTRTYSTAPGLAFTVNNSLLKRRRQWRVTFDTPTTYRVYERMIGFSTSLTKGTLGDDRAAFLSGSPSSGVRVNPNSRQAVEFDANMGSSTATAIQLLNAGDNLLLLANKGDPYYVEWAADPLTGTVGSPYTPVDPVSGDLVGISWTITAGTPVFSNGDSFLITVFQSVDNLLLGDDEIPQLSASNLSVSVKSAF